MTMIGEMTDEELEAFIVRMKRFRSRHELTQPELAYAIGVDVRTVNGVECRRLRPFPRFVLSFARLEERYAQYQDQEMERLEGLS